MTRDRELLRKLMQDVITIHIDMGGNHKYALNLKAHKTITEIKEHLSFIDDFQREI